MRSIVVTKKESTLKPIALTGRKKATLLTHMEQLVVLAEDSGLNDAFYTKAQAHIRFIAKKMDLTGTQAILFSLCINCCDDTAIQLSDFARFLNCKNIKVIALMNDMQVLEQRKLIRRKCTANTYEFRVPIEVVDAIKQNIKYTPPVRVQLNAEHFFDVLSDLFAQATEQEIHYQVLTAEICQLIEDNKQLKFTQQVRKHHLQESPDDLILLAFMAFVFVYNNDDAVGFNDMEILFEPQFFRRLKSALQTQTHRLIIDGFIECANAGSLGDRNYFRLTSQTKKEFLSELNINLQQVQHNKALITATTILPKQLFYGMRETTQLTQLLKLLQPDVFSHVQERLQANGMRKGFTCIFYGAPGTGKTETVYQLARQTGRDIMPVDISDTKSMWFGESEKKIKEIFEQYRIAVKHKEAAPILLFNEADAVLGMRKEGGQHSSIDQTENAIQNIILQEMENLEGIMIATTNLTQNLDKAFERRFLYKIQFERPGKAAKQAIWKSMLPELSDPDAEELALRYDFSGGQIENISRKRMIATVINDSGFSLDAIHDYCREELLQQHGRRKIGFVTSV